jgi:secreted trypsin-like serine protease
VKKNLIASPRAKIALMGGLVLALALIGWGTSALAITWGEPDTEGAYPNVGAMVVDTGNGLRQRCSGTLIYPQVFLTAGHCTDGLDADWPVWVNFDQDALNEDTLLVVEEVITHPDYVWGGSNPHDVGLLILADPVPDDITPATLPDLGFLDGLKQDGELRTGPEGAKFTVVGYGRTLDWYRQPPETIYVGQRQFAESEYKALVPAWLHMSQNMLQGDAGTCSGDSGGPAFWEPEEDTRILVGITSWGDPNCIATGFNYRVDIPETLTFIADVVPDHLP